MAVPMSGFAYALTAPTLQPQKMVTTSGAITAVRNAAPVDTAALSAISAKREASHDRAAIHSHCQNASLHRDARNPAQRFPRLPRCLCLGSPCSLGGCL